MPSSNKAILRKKFEAQVADLTDQIDVLRQQAADRAPAVRDQLIAALPDKSQLLDLRDDLFERLPENVQERLPEKVKPKRSRLRKVATFGILTGAGAAAFAVLRRQSTPPVVYSPPTPPVPPATVPPAPAAEPAAKDAPPKS